MTANLFKITIPFLFLALGISACQKDTDESPISTPPQQQIPNPLPEYARARQLKWSDTDHQTMTYDNKGQLIQLRSQWNYVQNDPSHIRTVVYDFEYDEKGLPVQVDVSGGYKIKYFYNDTLIEKTQELFPGGAVAKEVSYFYENKRIAQEIWKVSNLPGEPESWYKHSFTYDNKGNLTRIDVFQQDGNQQYELLETTEYSNFDNKLNTTSWMLHYPYLPQLQLQYNNPRKVVWQPAQGMPQTTSHVYTYNEDGAPASKRTTHPTGTITTMAYQY